MIRSIVRDVVFLGQKSEIADRADVAVGRDLRETLHANRDKCAGMAANMIGVRKRVIVVGMGPVDVVMYNPEIVRRDTPYEAEEGCLSLDGTRRTTRYQNIEVTWLDDGWKPRRQRFSGWIAQIIQHEVDHLDGVVI
ncbi:MAG: peptide deformylase [Clostridia bacterium]|nr:peptide deformylase [Clostridia bacterium]